MMENDNNGSFQDKYARLHALFEYAPVSLWEEDFSGIKVRLDDLRAKGITDLRAYINDHPQFVGKCLNLIKVLDVNQKTLELFGAKTKEELLSRLSDIFRSDMGPFFAEELMDFWNGMQSHEREGINYSLNGEPINIHLQWTVLPGYEATLGRVLVSIFDITARKRAGDYLKYLGTHDVLSGLYNRAYFVEARERIEKDGPYPVSIIVADLDSLKQVNDMYGHEEGDDLIRRAAEVLKAVITEKGLASRIGGDEFAVLLPATDHVLADQLVKRLLELIELNNTFYQGPPLQTSLGVSTAEDPCSLSVIQREADDRMYAEKRRHHREKMQPPE